MRKATKKKKKSVSFEKVAVSDSHDSGDEGTALSRVLARASVTDFNMLCLDSDVSFPVDDDSKEPVFLSDMLNRFHGHTHNVNEVNEELEHNVEEPVYLSDFFSKLNLKNVADISTVNKPELVLMSVNNGNGAGEELVRVDDRPMFLSELLTQFHESDLTKFTDDQVVNETELVLKCVGIDSEETIVSSCLPDSSHRHVKNDTADKEFKDVDADPMFLSDLIASFHRDDLKKFTDVDVEPECVFVSLEEQELCMLIEEAGARGVLDTACSRSVAGFIWVQNYTNSVSPEFAKSLKVLPSKKIFQFGGGERRQSHGTLSLPVVLGDKKITITIEMVDAQIPLLIGSNSMKLGEALINFQDNTATFFNEIVDMAEVGTGHFCINLLAPHVETHVNDVKERDNIVNHVLVTAENIDLKLLKKLHHYYGHTPPDRLLKLMKNAGKDVKNLKKPLLKIEKTCEACIRTKKRAPKPKSSIPRVDTANTIVTLDLKEWTFKGTKYYICYMIDMYSRLTMGNFIKDKSPESVIECIMGTWVPAFGLMRGIHSDIGGEFSNSTLEEVASRLDIDVTTTASYSPNQNGLNERNHAIVDIMITRMLLSDPSLKPRMALCWSLNAKNSLENCYGFTPFQLHIGRTPMMPSTTRGGPPSFENVTKSENFAAHLNAMHAARTEFIKAESSKSLKLAMKSMVYPRGDNITSGDDIYYKQKKQPKNVPEWEGPSKVVATNGKKLFVDKGARLGTVNRDDSVRKGEELWKFSDLQKEKKDEEAKESIARVLRNSKPKQLPKKVTAAISSSSESSSSEENEDDNASSEDEVDSAENGDEGELHTTPEETSDDEFDDRSDADEVDDQLGEDEITLAPGIPVAENERPQEKDEEVSTPPEEIKKHDIIQYVVPETGCSEISLVLKRAAKATGKKRFWWNVQVKETGEKKAVNLEAVKDLLKIATSDSDIIPTFVVTIPRNLHHNPECVEAKDKELQNWDQFGVYVEVPDEGQLKINTNWVLVRKAAAFVKARLCVRGDHEPNKDTIRTDSPTVNKINIKLFFVISVQNGWHVKTGDIKAAFLQGVDLDREVYVRPPVERRKDGIIWKMVKRAYGLVDASRGFYLELKRVLEEIGCVMSTLDPALFMYFGDHSSIQGLLLTHVDDLIHGAGTKEFYDVVLSPLKERFTFGSEEEDDFKYVGMHIKQVGATITTDQDAYVENLETPNTDFVSKGNLDDFLDEDGQSDFRSAVGQIGWVSNSSRPDLAFNHLLLSTKIGNACTRDMKLAVKTIKQIKCDTTLMKFVDLGQPKEWVLEGYGDAGHKSLPDKISSSCGYVLLLTNKLTGASSVLTWKSTKIRRVVGSSTAAEALATNETCDALMYILAVLKEILGDIEIPLHLYTDSKNLHNSVNTTALCNDHRMRIDISRLKESVEKGEVSNFELVSSDVMLADVLTKKGAAGFKLMNILRNGKY